MQTKTKTPHEPLHHSKRFPQSDAAAHIKHTREAPRHFVALLKKKTRRPPRGATRGGETVATSAGSQSRLRHAAHTRHRSVSKTMLTTGRALLSLCTGVYGVRYTTPPSRTWRDGTVRRHEGAQVADQRGTAKPTAPVTGVVDGRKGGGGAPSRRCAGAVLSQPIRVLRAPPGPRRSPSP